MNLLSEHGFRNCGLDFREAVVWQCCLAPGRAVFLMHFAIYFGFGALCLTICECATRALVCWYSHEMPTGFRVHISVISLEHRHNCADICWASEDCWVGAWVSVTISRRQSPQGAYCTKAYRTRPRRACFLCMPYVYGPILTACACCMLVRESIGLSSPWKAP